MGKENAVERVLKAVGITDSQVDLVGRILSLEEDRNRVHSVELHHATVGYNGLSADVYLLRNFQDVSEFREYLSAHELPAERTWEKDESYFLQNDGIKSQFYVPEFYPKR